MKAALAVLLAVPAALQAAPDTAHDGGHDWLNGTWRAQGDGLLHSLDGKPVPLTAKAASAWARVKPAFLAGDPKVDPARRCKPPGEPRLMADPGTPFSVIVTGPRVLFAYQWNRLVRMIEMESPREVIGPTYFGQNAGHWEGDTLVVDVQGLHEGVALDKSGLPHGEKLRITERFRALDKDRMEMVAQFTDPDSFTRPWSARLVFQRQPGLTVAEDICLDREHLVGKLVDPNKVK